MGFVGAQGELPLPASSASPTATVEAALQAAPFSKSP